jgi:hypothetical protein
VREEEDGEQAGASLVEEDLHVRCQRAARKVTLFPASAWWRQNLTKVRNKL